MTKLRAEAAQRLANILKRIRDALQALNRREWVKEKSGDTIATVDSETGRLVD